MRNVLLAIATGTTGLTAGVFLAFSVSVMPALGASDPRTFVTTMNRINVAIVNPIFMLLLFGSPVILVIVSLLAGPRRGWVILALVLNLAAVVVTMVVNVPLNNGLARTGLTDPVAARSAFENLWNAAHLVRTVLLAGSLSAAIVALAGAAERG